MATATAPNIDLTRTVKAYGSLTKLAERLGLTLSTVHGWQIRKKIPVWRQKEIVTAANEDGHDIKRLIKKPRRRRAAP